MQLSPVAQPLRTRSWHAALLWVPTLYLAMGIPYNVVQSTAARMYQSLGVGEEKIALALGWLAIAWSAKPLWAGLLERLGRKRTVIIAMQLLIAVLLLVAGALAVLLDTQTFFAGSLGLLAIIAFASATQDICGDGLYLAGLGRKDQARLSGVQGTFWVSGKVVAAGLLISAADALASREQLATSTMWATVMGAAGALMGALALYHVFALPPSPTRPLLTGATSAWVDLQSTATTFLQKRELWGMLSFVLLYRVGEGLLMMSGPLFLQAPVASGGVGFTAGEVAVIDSTYGTVASLLGGLAGGAVCAKLGLRRCLWFFALMLNVPHACYAVLGELAARGTPLEYTLVATLVSIEKAGYGFGFVANMVYLMQQVAPGRSMMTHYAYGTALMNIVLMPTAMLSGSLCSWLGYRAFFWWVLPVSVVSLWAAKRAPFPIDGAQCEPLTNANGVSDDLVTVDDDTRLNSRQRDLKRLAARASGPAMAHVMLILVADTTLLGALRGNVTLVPAAWWGAILTTLLALKISMALRTRTAMHVALAHARDVPPGEAEASTHAYEANARSAWVATRVCLAIDVVLFGTGMALLAT